MIWFIILLLLLAAIGIGITLNYFNSHIEGYQYSGIQHICERYPYIREEVKRRLQYNGGYLNQWDYNALVKMRDKASQTEEYYKLRDTVFNRKETA